MHIITKTSCVDCIGHIVLVGVRKNGQMCVITADTVEEIQEDWRGTGDLVPKDLNKVLYAAVDGREVRLGMPTLDDRAKPEDVIPNLQVNTKIVYLYRDADNYKRMNAAIVKGTITKEQVYEIIKSCEDGEHFIPEQVGLPATRMEEYEYNADSDTPFFELMAEHIELTGQKATVDMTAEELVQAFQKTAGHWDASIDFAW